MRLASEHMGAKTNNLFPITFNADNAKLLLTDFTCFGIKTVLGMSKEFLVMQNW